MTRSRIVDPGATLALSRRTTRRHFLLNPDEARQMERVYWYCLAYAAKLHGILVHAACLMSTHSHEVITDVRGEYPKFLQTFHRYLALCTKAYRGWPEEVFNKDSSGAHALLTPEATLEAIAYLIANPVEAGAVRYAKDWPGAHTLPAHVGTRVIRVKRPTHYFDPNNPEWPEELELRLEMPVALEVDYGPELARERIVERVRDKQHHAWNRAKRTGLSFVGPRRVLRLAHTERARSYEVFGSLNPQFAAAGNRAAATEAVKRLRAFKAQYARALGAWTAGDRSTFVVGRARANLERFGRGPGLCRALSALGKAHEHGESGGGSRRRRTALSGARAQRRSRDQERKTPTRIGHMVLISERPAEIEDRAVPGHWEGDLIIGKNSKSQVGTLVERSTRFVMLVRLPHDRSAHTVRKAIARKITHLPQALKRSLTWDQGTEMAEHVRFTVATCVPVYFCDPRSPWQRGTNENTNGLLRQYMPKGMGLSALSNYQLNRIADELNTRPRQTLGWMTPAQKFAQLVASAP